MFERLFGDKFSRFRLGQIIFAAAVSFGLFAGDIIRIVLGVLALFCLTKENFKFNWTREQKITGCILALCCAWMIVIPVIFGENPLPVRLRDAVRPVELTLWICATLLFAKDEFFVRNLKNFSITACFLYSLIALAYCFKINFVCTGGYIDWPIIHSSYALSSLMSGFAVWYTYMLVTEKKLFKHVFSFAMFLTTLILTMLAGITTYRLAFAAEIAALFIILLISDRKKFAKLFAIFAATFLCAAFAIFAAAQHSPSLQTMLDREFNQLRIENGKKFDIERMSNHRYHIWVDAANAIKQKPLFGYGREIFAKYCSTQHIHTHNTFLQAAFEAGFPAALLMYAIWLMVFILAVLQIYKAHDLLCMPFVTAVIMSGFLAASLVENQFLFTNRCQMVFYWSIFITLLNTAGSKNSLYRQ